MKWISVKTKLPSKEGKYMLYDGDEVFAGNFNICKDGRTFWGIQACDGICYGNFSRDEYITHWSEMPEPPKDS